MQRVSLNKVTAQKAAYRTRLKSYRALGVWRSWIRVDDCLCVIVCVCVRFCVFYARLSLSCVWGRSCKCVGVTQLKWNSAPDHSVTVRREKTGWGKHTNTHRHTLTHTDTHYHTHLHWNRMSRDLHLFYFSEDYFKLPPSVWWTLYEQW